jgi:orotate phosphoribosyltransferase
MSENKERVADALIAAGIVGFAFDEPRTFKSGILSPVYVDNRKLLMNPQAWRVVMAELRLMVEMLNLENPIIAGIEAAGIPHSSVLAYEMSLPSVFVRKEAKGHGLKQRIEGGDVTGRHVILIEDQVTTGGSSLSGVTALRDAGAIVDHCLAITSYGFPESWQAFADAGVNLHILTGFDDVLPRLLAAGVVNHEQLAILMDWLSNPVGWQPRARA